jgi:hypothetical protein
VCASNSLAAVAPEVAAEWHGTRNGNVTPADVLARSHASRWFQCPVSPDHEWLASVGRRVAGGRKCPCCANRKVYRPTYPLVLA